MTDLYKKRDAARLQEDSQSQCGRRFSQFIPHSQFALPSQNQTQRQQADEQSQTGGSNSFGGTQSNRMTPSHFSQQARNEIDLAEICQELNEDILKQEVKENRLPKTAKKQVKQTQRFSFTKKGGDSSQKKEEQKAAQIGPKVNFKYSISPPKASNGKGVREYFKMKREIREMQGAQNQSQTLGQQNPTNPGQNKDSGQAVTSLKEKIMKKGDYALNVSMDTFFESNNDNEEEEAKDDFILIEQVKKKERKDPKKKRKLNEITFQDELDEMEEMPAVQNKMVKMDTSGEFHVPYPRNPERKNLSSFAVKKSHSGFQRLNNSALSENSVQKSRESIFEMPTDQSLKTSFYSNALEHFQKEDSEDYLILKVKFKQRMHGVTCLVGEVAAAHFKDSQVQEQASKLTKLARVIIPPKVMSEEELKKLEPPKKAFTSYKLDYFKSKFNFSAANHGQMSGLVKAEQAKILPNFMEDPFAMDMNYATFFCTRITNELGKCLSLS